MRGQLQQVWQGPCQFSWREMGNRARWHRIRRGSVARTIWSRIVRFGVVIAIVGMGMPAWAEVPAATGRAAPVAVAPDADQPWLTVEKDVWLPVVDDFGRQLLAARESFLANRLDKAGVEIRKATELLQSDSMDAGQRGQFGFAEAINELEELADELEHGTRVPRAQLDEIFARAYYVDIKNYLVTSPGYEQAWVLLGDTFFGHLVKAREEFSKGELETAATEIRKAAALLNLEASRPTDQGKRELLASVRALNEVAAAVESANVTSIRDFDVRVARAHHPLLSVPLRARLGALLGEAGPGLGQLTTVLGHAVLAFLLAVGAVLTLVAGLRLQSPWKSGWALFSVLFLTIWAGGIWVAPFGPGIWNIYWLPFLLIAILVAVLIAAIAPPRVHTAAEEHEREREIELGLGLFFWVLIGGLILAIVLRYL
jgi:hypothetical protein